MTKNINPIKMYEYLAAGLPVVTTQTGGASMLIESDINGLVVPHDRTDLLAGAMQELLADKRKRLRMAQANRQKSKTFSTARMVDDTLKVYQDLVRR